MIVSDAPRPQGHVNGRLLYGLALEEEEQFLIGAGTGLNMEGLNVAASAYTGGVTNDTALDTLAFAPAIFQEALEGPDVRVTYVGGVCLAARIECGSSPTGIVDARYDLDVPCPSWSLPASVESAIRRFMGALGLRFGTIDMKIDASGNHVFLEVNPGGQFVYVEILSGLPLSRTMAELLLSLAESHQAQEPGRPLTDRVPSSDPS